jgi:3-isopropylmalate/(R)-2-methylmalate dehydratase small subunit
MDYEFDEDEVKTRLERTTANPQHKITVNLAQLAVTDEL